MTLAILGAVLAALQADATLESLLGSSGRIHFGYYTSAQQLPGVYVTAGTSDRSTPRPGFATIPTRDCDDLPAVHTFAATPEAAEAIADRIAAVLFAGIVGGRVVNCPSRSLQPDPDTPGLWHAAQRFAIIHSITDT